MIGINYKHETTLTWSEIEPNNSNLAELFSGKQIVGVEVQSFPLVDALCFALFDDEHEQMQFVLVEIDEPLLVGDLASVEGSPLIVKVSEPVIPSPA